jgi:hypothetical protein
MNPTTYASLRLQENFPDYTQMVQNLFNVDLPGPHSGLLHAAIGLAGESGELRSAESRDNLREECGDMEFYLEALELQLAAGYQGIYDVQDSRLRHITLGNVLDNVHTLSSDILDLAKKAWVYKDREVKWLELYSLSATMRRNLDVLYELTGFTQSAIRYNNQCKLIGDKGRYKSGKYSNEAALAREDKNA